MIAAPANVHVISLYAKWFGVDFATNFGAAFTAPLTVEMVNGSPSISVSLGVTNSATPRTRSVSSVPVTASLAATGASLTAFTVIVTVAVLDVSASHYVTVDISDPRKKLVSLINLVAMGGLEPPTPAL